MGDFHVYIVTGLLRSGTARTAEAFHQAGFWAATSMSPPVPPDWKSEWEDAEAFSVLIAAAPWGHEPDDAVQDMFSVWFPDYLLRRMQVAQAVGNMTGFDIRGVTCKSPLYALFLPAIRNLQKYLPCGISVVECQRDVREIDASLKRTHGRLGTDHLKNVKATNRLIRAALRNDRNDRLVVKYEDDPLAALVAETAGAR